MIMSGWILPDMHEVKCLSCSGTNGHLKIVKEYLSKLREKDYSCYTEVLYEYYKLRTCKKVLDLEDFAVIKLGWIKIINSPIKIVFYSPETPMDLLIERYANLGYSPIVTKEKQIIINVRIPSHELI